MEEERNKNILTCIDITDKLRKYGYKDQMDLTSVVIIGDETSNKTTILETLSGIPLARKSFNLFPIEFQFRRVPHQPWRSFITYTNKNGIEESIMISEPNNVSKLIGEAQERIIVKIESPAELAPELTLIDLPNIFESSSEDQISMKDLELKDIMTDYLSNRHTLIVCVIAGYTEDLIDETLRIAEKYDVEGDRTIVVFTKPEMVIDERKSDILSLLNHEKPFSKKEYFMVKCQSQNKINIHLSMAESLEEEILYFNNDKYYKNINSSQLGLKNLVNRIRIGIVGDINMTLSRLRIKIDKAIIQTKQLLKDIPKEIPEKTSEKQIHLMEKLMLMNDEMKICLEKGRISFDKKNVFVEWRNYFNDYKLELDVILEDAIEREFSKSKIQKLLSNKRGDELFVFMNYDLFANLMWNHVKQYRQYANILLDQISASTEAILYKILDRHFNNISTLHSKFKKIIRQQIEICKIKSIERIKCIFKEEKLIFTLDSSFEKELSLLSGPEAIIYSGFLPGEDKPAVSTNSFAIPLKGNQNSSLFGTKTTISAPITNSSDLLKPTKAERLKIKKDKLKKSFQMEKSKLSSKNENHFKRLLDTIKTYLKIAHSRITDSVPMSIRRSIHIELYKTLKDNLILYIMQPISIEHLEENKNVVEERELLKRKLDVLELAKKELLECD